MCACPGDCEGGPECLDDEGGPLTMDNAAKSVAKGFLAGLGAQDRQVAQMMDRIARDMIGALLKPSVGRVVHYVSHGTPPRPDGSQAFASECRAAIVTEVDDDATVGLFVANPTGVFLNRGVSYDETGTQGGSWHWPERVE